MMLSCSHAHRQADARTLKKLNGHHHPKKRAHSGLMPHHAVFDSDIKNGFAKT
jgi:hypothetical protein